jgi:hypothetical protein
VIRGTRGIRIEAATRGLAIAIAVACLSWPTVATADEADSKQIRDQTERALDSDDIQRDAPLAERVRQKSQTVTQDPTLQHDKPTPSEPPPQVKLPIPGDLFLYLLLGTLAVALCIVAYHLYKTYAPNKRAWSKRGDQPVDLAAKPIARTGEEPLPELDEIERLARAGAYAEAIHLMLLRALEALRRQLGINWAKSMTSREIARRAELGPTDRRALRVLVGAVEISRFGGQNANEQVYRTCLDHYRLIGTQPTLAQA